MFLSKFESCIFRIERCTAPVQYFFFLWHFYPIPCHILPSRGFTITHNDAPQCLGFLWTSDQPEAQAADITQHSQHTNIHAPKEIRTRSSSKQVAVDPRLRPHGHWDWHYNVLGVYCLNLWISVALGVNDLAVEIR